MYSIFKTFFLSLCIIANTHFAFAQTASILPQGKTQFLDNNGNPLTSGTVGFYIPSTLTFKTTWQNSAESISNTNPVVLDAGGRAIIYGDGNYRMIVKDRLGNLVYDQLTSSTGSGSSTPTTSTGDGDLVGTIKPWGGMTAPNQYMFTYGQEINRTTYAILYTAITSTQAVFCNSGSPILNGLSDTTNFWIGMSVEATCVAAGFSTIIDKTSTTVTLAANANVTTNVNAVFYPWGRGNGSTTFNLPDFRGLSLTGNNNMGGVASTNSTVPWFGATNPNSIGAKGGQESYRLSLPNIPDMVSVNLAQAITVSTANHFPISSLNWAGTTIATAGAVTIPFTGGSIGDGQSLGPTNNSISTTYTNAGGGAISATVAAGGSGYTNGSQLLTLTGGTCSIAPQFTVTVVAGAITAPAVLFREGLCTVKPTNPVSTSGGGGTLGTLTVTWSQGAFSTVSPTKTVNYIIKVTPDTNSATASGVTSLGLMTGDIACGTNLTCSGNIISAVTQPTPAPTAVTLGGVFSLTCASSNWFRTLATSGTFGCSQPNFTDLAGSIAAGQIPNNLISNAMIRQGVARSVIGVTGNAGANVADIQGTANQALVVNNAGTALAFGQVNLAAAAAVTGTLPLANGGTNDTGTVWASFAASPACGSAAITNTSSRSKTLGKTMWLEIDFTITALGTCTTALTFTLPSITVQSGGGLAGREFGVSGKGFTCDVRPAGTTSTCSLADFTALQVNAHMVASGVIEIQ